MVAICFLALNVQVAAQAILPTSWGFDTPAPTGWTQALQTGNTTYATGVVGVAARLDQTGDYVLVQFAEEPGSVNYSLQGKVGNGVTNWTGTFTLEESADGVTFTPLHTFTDNISVAAFVLYTDQPQATTRYLRWYFTNKVSGYNVALDEITVTTPAAGAAQEINIVSGTNNVPSGTQFITGNAPSTTFTIQNQGLVDSLNVSSITISGPNASDFSILNAPSAPIAANSSADFQLSFAPTSSGSEFCTITITNDDASEGTYTINIYAISGTLASEPSAQATGLTFSNVSAWDYNVAFTAGNPAAEKYLVLRRKGSAVATPPADGQTYVVGQWIANAQVVYSGDAGSFNARFVEASTTYHYAVYAYNGPSGYENYLTTSPLINNVVTSGPDIANFYSGVNHNAASFVNDLTAALNPSNYLQIFYSNYISTIIDKFYVKDTAIAGQSYNMVECQYSGSPYVYQGAFSWWNGTNDATLSREHCYPQSWMPTYNGTGFSDSEPVSDLHVLLPVRQVECNNVRSNYPYGEVVTPSNTYLGTQFGSDQFNQDVYEPRNSIKGDAARAMMYEAVKYNNATENWSFPENISFVIPYGQWDYLIKKWHFQDVPDNYEIARNEYVMDTQRNRNPFVDSVLFPCYIRFSTLTKWQPTTLFVNGVLQCADSAVSYQWFKDGVAISGANANTFVPTSSGAYTIDVRQFSQCPVFSSNPLNVVGITEELNSGFAMQLYPNPGKSDFVVRVSSAKAERATLKVFDASGRLIESQQHMITAAAQNIHLNLTLAAGVYTVAIQTDSAQVSERLIVE